MERVQSVLLSYTWIFQRFIVTSSYFYSGQILVLNNPISLNKQFLCMCHDSLKISTKIYRWFQSLMHNANFWESSNNSRLVEKNSRVTGNDSDHTLVLSYRFGITIVFTSLFYTVSCVREVERDDKCDCKRHCTVQYDHSVVRLCAVCLNIIYIFTHSPHIGKA